MKTFRKYKFGETQLVKMQIKKYCFKVQKQSFGVVLKNAEACNFVKK